MDTYKIISLFFPFLSLIFLINVMISRVIFNNLKKLDMYFIVSKPGNFNKYYFYGIIYIFRINEMINYEKYTYYKLYLEDIYVKMSPIHKPIEQIREIKENIKMYERKIKLEKIRKKVKINKFKRIYK